MTLPTVAQFAALVAQVVPEIKAADAGTFAALTAEPSPGSHQPGRKADPAAFAGVEWVTTVVDGHQAAAVIGWKYRKTFKVYADRSKRQRRDGHTGPRLLPLPLEGIWETEPGEPGPHWELGTLLIWEAVRKSRVLDAPNPRWRSHEDYFPEIHRQMADPKGAHTKRTMGKALRAAGFHVTDDFANLLMNEAGYTARKQTVGDDVLVPIAKGLMKRPGPFPRARDLISAAAEQGYTVSPQTASRVLGRVGADKLPQMESDTLIYGEIRPGKLAWYAGTSPQAISWAMATCWYCGGRAGDPWHGEGYRAAWDEPRAHKFHARLTPRRHDGESWLIDFRKIKKVKVPKAGLLRTPVDSDLRPEDHNMYAVRPSRA